MSLGALREPDGSGRALCRNVPFCQPAGGDFVLTAEWKSRQGDVKAVLIFLLQLFYGCAIKPNVRHVNYRIYICDFVLEGGGAIVIWRRRALRRNLPFLQRSGGILLWQRSENPAGTESFFLSFVFLIIRQMWNKTERHTYVQSYMSNLTELMWCVPSWRWLIVPDACDLIQLTWLTLSANVSEQQNNIAF